MKKVNLLAAFLLLFSTILTGATGMARLVQIASATKVSYTGADVVPLELFKKNRPWKLLNWVSLSHLERLNLKGERLLALRSPGSMGFHWPKVLASDLGNWVNGTWVVSGTEVYKDKTIILTGDLIVEPDGNLTLINCTLLVNCTYGGQYTIRVEPEGAMNILKNSNITAYNPMYEYDFRIYGKLTIMDSYVSGCYGLELFTEEEVLLQDTIITKCYYGIYCKSAHNITISGCTVSNNNHTGIYCYSSSDITVSNCMISDNDQVGVHCEFTHDITISGCVINDNTFGLFYYNAHDTLVLDCMISNNSVGILCSFPDNITISSCAISGNGYVGIDCGHPSNIAILNCTISGNGQDGIRLEYASNGTISNCTISYNNQYGVFCRYSWNIAVYKCSFVHDGVFLDCSLDQCISCLLENNTVNSKPLYYIVNTVSYVVPSDAGEIIVVNSTFITIESINASQADIGLEIIYSKNVQISDVITSRNDVGGILCRDSSDITILNCTVSFNGQYGIGCLASSYMEVHYCNIYSNEGHGLYNYGDYVVNAINCWWGSPDGPERKATGDPYDPEEVWGNVIYEPWLTEPWTGQNIGQSATGTVGTPQLPNLEIWQLIVVGGGVAVAGVITAFFLKHRRP